MYLTNLLKIRCPSSWEKEAPLTVPLQATPAPRKAARWGVVGWPQIKAKARYISLYVQPAMMTSRSQGHSPFQPWVSQPFSDSLYSLSRLPSKLVLNWALQYRHQMEFQGSKTHKEIVLSSPNKTTQEPGYLPQASIPQKARAPLDQKWSKLNCLGPLSWTSYWDTCNASPWGHNRSLDPLLSGSFITFFWVRKGLTVISNALLVLYFHNFSYTLV